MGLVKFYEIIEGNNLVNAFDKFQYSRGYASSKSPMINLLNEPVMSFKEFSERNKEKATKKIELLYNSMEPNIAMYVDLGVYSYEIPSYKKELNKRPSKFKTKYVVSALWIFNYPGEFVFDDKAEAEAKAIELTMLNNIEYIMTREPVLVEGSKTIIKYKPSKKKIKQKPNNGIKFEEVRQYIFFGWKNDF